MNVRLSKVTASQRKEALQIAKDEIQKIIPVVKTNVEAIMLYQLHKQLGFGRKRLIKFFNDTAPLIDGMLEYYGYDTDEDAIWLCKHKLKEIGIDLDEMNSPFSAKVEYK